MEQGAESRELVDSRDVPANMALRARIVQWSGEGRRRKEISGLLGGVAVDRGPLEELICPSTGRLVWKVPVPVLSGGRFRRGFARVIALTHMTRPAVASLSHWSMGELVKYLKRSERVGYVARVWREENLKPHRKGTRPDRSPGLHLLKRS